MSRRGFSLIELMVVVVMVGVMALIGYPKLQGQFTKAELRAATTRLTAVYAQARATAVQTGRATTVNVLGNRIFITQTVNGVLDTVGTVQHLDSLYKVTLSYNEYADDLIRFDARGMLTPRLAGAGEITLSRGGYARVVTLGQYGSIVHGNTVPQ